MTRETKIKAVEKIPITGQGYTLGKLLNGTDCQILLDTGMSKSYMSKAYNLRCKSLHAFPKFASNTQRIKSWKWTICRCTLCNTSDYRCTWP